MTSGEARVWEIQEFKEVEWKYRRDARSVTVGPPHFLPIGLPRQYR
jgi:hypothetical protein